MSSSTTSSGKGPRDKRSLIACERCRRLKKKCKPEAGRARCERCKVTDQTCSYGPASNEKESQPSRSPSDSYENFEPTITSTQNPSTGFHLYMTAIVTMYSGSTLPNDWLRYQENDILRTDGVMMYNGEHGTRIFLAQNPAGARGFVEAANMTPPVHTVEGSS